MLDQELADDAVFIVCHASAHAWKLIRHSLSSTSWYKLWKMIRHYGINLAERDWVNKWPHLAIETSGENGLFLIFLDLSTRVRAMRSPSCLTTFPSLALEASYQFLQLDDWGHLQPDSDSWPLPGETSLLTTVPLIHSEVTNVKFSLYKFLICYTFHRYALQNILFDKHIFSHSKFPVFYF